MELGGQSPARGEHLRPRLAATPFGERGRNPAHVEVPLQPRSGGHLGDIRLDPVPAHLGPGRPFDRTAQGMGHDLGPETDPENGNPLVMGTFHKSTFGVHQLGHPWPVHTPLRPEQEHQIGPGQIGPVGRPLAVTLAERVSLGAQVMTDETRVGVVGIGDHEGAHTSTVGRAVPTRSDREVANVAIEITDDDIRRAREAGSGVVKHTPVTSSFALSERTGGQIVLKAENLQRTGSFKIRGAMNKLATLGSAASAGVTAGSAGNHAQALAFAARSHGVPCEIYVPKNAPIAKMAACRSYGATVIEGGDSLDDAVVRARARAEETGMAFCHPYDDPVVVAGQATLGFELLDDVKDLQRVIIPLGGGGLASGVAIAVKRQLPHVKVIGVQVEACAPYANGQPPSGPVITLADGIAVKRPGDVTRPLVEKWLDDVVVVDENAVADAMVLLMERSKLYVEGAGAVGVSALLSEHVAPARHGITCVVLSGGNVDLGVVPGLIRRHETQAGRRLIVFVRVSDRPGGLAQLLAIFAEQGASVIDIEHVREGVDLQVRETGVNAVLEVRGPEHSESVIEAVRAAGYAVAAP